MKNKSKIINVESLYKGWSTLMKYTVQYFRENGQVELQEREIFDSGDGAAVLLYNPISKKIILISQFRLPVLLSNQMDGFIWECCAGLLDRNNPEQAIIKEIREETGYQIKKATKIYEAFASPGAHMEKIHFFHAEYHDNDKVSNGGGLENEQEEIIVKEFNYDEVVEMLESGSIIDSKTIVLLQWALINVIKKSC